MSLPIIDLAAFLTPNSTKESKRAAAASLNAACRDVGFFYLRFSLPGTLEQDALSAARTFFTKATPLQKSSIYRIGARGYQRLNENITNGKSDAHEAIDFYRPDSNPDHGIVSGENQWPQQPGFRETFEAFWDGLLKLGDAVMVAMAWALGYQLPHEEDVFLRSTRNAYWVARVIGYPELGDRAEEEGISCGEHSDYGCTTFLLADETPGALQVLTKAGEWISADPIPGCYVVNIGDMMEVWTNGLWKSTLHRVVHKKGGLRVSIPFFYEPDFDAVVKPLEKCVQATGGEVKYGSKVYGKHLLGKVDANFYGGED